MSVTIVSDEMLSAITNAVFHVAMDRTESHFILDFCKREGMDDDQQVAFINLFDNEDAFIYELSRLNHMAYAQRYNEPTTLWRPKFTPDVLFSGDLSWPQSTTRVRRRLMQALKFMRCWMYQVSESKTACQKYIYKFVDCVSRELSHELILRSNEYEEMRWSC